MKKRLYIIIAGVVLVALGALWYCMPVHVLKSGVQDVSSINIFDGSTGKSINVSDAADLEYLVNNLRAVRMKRGRISLGYMGYRFRVTVYDKNDKQVSFIIDSEDSVRKDPFFYNVEEGKIDVAYIQSMFAE